MAISPCAVSSPATEPAGVNVAESGRPLDPQTWQARHDMIGAHLEDEVAHEEWIQTVEYDASIPRWYVRFGCDGRDAATIYFDLHQRTLRYELYFLPAPDDESRLPALHAWLLRRNHDLYGARFSLGRDGDVYLTGRVALEHLTTDELDRIIGVLYELTERWFQAAVTIAYR